MEFYEAIELAQKNENLIGKSFKGSIIHEIILVPTDFEEEKEFENLYVRYLDGKRAIALFTNSDVVVKCVVNKNLIQRLNLLSMIDLKDIIDSMPQNQNVINDKIEQ
jgi:hypothetical protein